MSCNLQLNNIDESLDKITKALLKNSDDLFKLLKYISADALSGTITEDDKYKLIDQDDKKNRRIIFQPWKKDMVTDDVRSEIRIYMRNMVPEDRYLGVVFIGFDIIVHDSLWQLKGGVQRALRMAHEIYRILNANEVDFLGKLDAGGNPMGLRDFGDSFTGYSFALSSGTN